MASSERTVMCPICYLPHTQPKQLSCTHTFCEACLTVLLSAQTRTGSIHCPVCRRSTDIGNEGVLNLATNIPLKAIVPDVKSSEHHCNNCDNGLETEYYCVDCEYYFCSDCHEIHDKLRRNANHEVVRADDVKEGKVIPGRKVLCQEHEPGEGEYECTDVCITCKKFICLRCRMLKHEKNDHEVASAVQYQDSYTRDAESLRVIAQTKKTNVMKYAELIEGNKRKVVKHIDSLTSKIDKTYNEMINRLKEDKLVLDMKCRVEKERLCQELDDVKIQGEQLVGRIDSADSLVTKSCQTPLGVNALQVRESLCDQLKQVLGEVDPSIASVQDIARRAGQLKYEQNRESVGATLGKVEYNEWVIKADVALSAANTINCLAATPDGKMAVGCVRGERGIEIYFADGQLQQRVLKEVKVHGIAFLTDGRCVVRDTGNTNELILNVSLYTRVWQKVDVRFETLSWDKGGYGNLTADSNDQIYVGYIKANKIHVFTAAGGKPVREITCNRCKPMQIFAMNLSNMIVVLNYINSACIINASGFKQRQLTMSQSSHVYPAVCKDDTILIATVNGTRDRVTIEHYTSEMKHVATLITDHEIQKSEGDWYYVQVFTSGEIAFCTTDRLYIFEHWL